MSSPLVRSAFSALLFAGLSLAHEAPASAIERQHHLGLSPTLSILKVDAKETSSPGGGLTLHYAYGLTDQFNFMFEGGSSALYNDVAPGTEGAPATIPTRVDHAGVGIGYVLDILRWVPYFGVMGTGYVLNGGTLPKAAVVVGVALAAGLDYQLGRHFALGIAVRQGFPATQLSTYPSFTQVLLRAEYVWGY